MAVIAPDEAANTFALGQRGAALRRGWLLASLVALPFAAAYLLAALAMPLPWSYIPDESFYGHLARSLAHGDGFTWRGEHDPLRSALYVYAIAPAWALADGAAAYEIAKAITTLLSVLVAVPVFLVARTLLPMRLALLTVALGLAGTWMNTGELMTESIALVFATGALAAAVVALQRGSQPLIWLALLLAVLAAWARMQTVVILGVVLAALVVDLLRSGPDRGLRWRTHRLPLLAGAALLAAGGLVLGVRGSRTLFGTYANVVSERPAVGAVLRDTAYELFQLGAAVGVLPLALLAVVALHRRAWRDPVVGPLLAVLVPACLVLGFENGFYVASIEGLWPIQRYMTYAAPLLLVFAVASIARPWLASNRTFAGAALASVAWVLLPAVSQRGEQPGAFAVGSWGSALLPNIGDGVSVAVLGVLLAGVAAATTWRAARGRGIAAAPIAVGGLLLLALVAQTATLYSWQLRTRQGERSVLPADLEWVDHHSRGPVAAFVVSSVGFEWQALDFFNRRISQVYAITRRPAGGNYAGGTCLWKNSPGGTVSFGCPLHTDTFLLNDPSARVTFYDELSTVADPHLGRLVRVRPPVRLEAIVQAPCDRRPPLIEPVTFRMRPDLPVPCQPALVGFFWLRRPGTLEVIVRGAPASDHLAAVGGERHRIPRARITTIRVPVPAGDHEQVRVDFDWAQTSELDPAVVAVNLVQPGRRQRLA